MKEKTLKLIRIFLLLSPFLDMLTAFMLQVLNIDFTIGMIVRFLIIIICLYYLIFIYKKANKKYLLIILGSIILYLSVFALVTLINKGSDVFLLEMKNALKTFYLPILLLGFYAISCENKEFLSNKTIITVYITYLLGIFIPDILGIGFDSYEVSKTGSIGFFNTANEISAIISILMPFFLLYLYQKKSFILTILLVGVLVFDILSIGTKGPLLAFFIIIFVLVIIYIGYLIKNKFYKKLALLTSVIVILSSVMIIYLPKSAFYKNIQIHLDFLEVDNITEIFTDYKLFDHFVFSSRLEFLSNTYANYEEAPIIEKLFGIGYIENYGTDASHEKMIEMDYFDILFRHGIVGFSIYILIFLYFLIRAFKYNHTIKDNNFKICTYLSLFLIIALSFITGHVLLAPAVSIFVAIILTRKEVIE